MATSESVGRREFLAAASVAAAAVATGAGEARAAEGDMPTLQLGQHRLSRVLCGWNPIGGHSHSTLDMAYAMREYFTTEKVVEMLQGCVRNGITGWQFDHTEKSVESLRLLREQAQTALKVICLHAARFTDVPIAKVIADTQPIAMVHHGGVTDSLFRVGQQQKVRDYVKQVKDAGLLAGVSSHNPEFIKRIADEGWENDFFMCCFYHVSRPADEQRKMLGRTVVGEPFLDTDPVEMTAVMRAVPKPCLGFKILAAGRLSWTTAAHEAAFKYAYANIKPTDGVIVGMFPRYADQVSQNAALARKYGGG